MNRSFVSLAFLALTSALTFAGTGCTVGKCDNGDDNCTQAETDTRYDGNPASTSVPYTKGQGVRIDGANGSIDVKVGGSKVEATFNTFSFRPGDDDGEAQAQDDLANDLILEVTAGNPVVIGVSRKSGASGDLGADIEVTLPDGFNGSFEVLQGNGSTEVNLGSVSPSSTRVISDNGSIDVVGATGELDIQTDNGDVTVSVSTWAVGGVGTIASGLGDVSVSLPADADGSVSLYAPDGVVDATLPSAWTKEEAAANSVTFAMGDGAGAHVDITAESLSDIRATTN